MAEIIGLRALQKKLQAERDNRLRACKRGLLKAGLLLQRMSQQIVPVDTAALKNSAFTREGGTEMEPEVRVGYTQAYAVFVHENLEARHKEGKVAKYLEKPARENRDELVKIIIAEAKK